MGKLAEYAARALIWATGATPVPVHAPLSRLREDEAKSLRDGAMAGDVITGAGIGIVHQTSGSDTRRLFKKRDVRLLRAYAEYSVWVRAAIDIYHRTVAPAEWTLGMADRTRAMNAGVEREVSELLNHPNQLGETYSTIKKKMIEDFLVLGHGAVELLLRRDAIPRGLRVIDAARLGFVQGWDGSRPDQPRYALLDAGLMKPERYFADAQVMCLVNRPRSYDLLGLSHIEVLDLAVRALLEGDDFHLRQISQPAPSGALNLGEGTTGKQVDQVRADIQAVKRAFIVMGGTKGTSFIKFDGTERDMRLLDKQVWFVRQVAAIFQVSTAALRLAVDTSRANTEAMFENDQEGPAALLKEVREIENGTIIRRWGKVEEHNVKLDYPIMSQKDEKQQSEIASTEFAGMPWASMNEARRRTGLEEWDTNKYPFADEALIATPAGPVPMSIWQDRVKEPPPDPTPPGDNSPPPPASGEKPKPKPGEQQKSLGGHSPLLLKAAGDAVEWSAEDLDALIAHETEDLADTRRWLKRLGQTEAAALFGAVVEEE